MEVKQVKKVLSEEMLQMRKPFFCDLTINTGNIYIVAPGYNLICIKMYLVFSIPSFSSQTKGLAGFSSCTHAAEWYEM